MRKLADRFMLEREIGTGGMARVFLGRDEVLDRPVAVKVLKPMHGDTEIGARFRREGRTAARLSHPNIVQVYDAGEAELDGRETSYIVMEYLSGGDLKVLIDEEGKLDAPELARIGEEVCSGLAHAHGRGVVHRDIKPHNILLDDHGRAKVSDFGIARALDTAHATRTGAYLGTALYSSPEQLQGHKVTFKSDVYSLGTTLYQAATGEPLFTGSPIEIASQHVSKPPPPMHERNPELDLGEELESLILACLSKEVDDRPSAEQASARFGKEAAAFGTVHEQEPPAPPPLRQDPPRSETPRPVPAMARSGGGSRRRGRLAGILAGVAVLAVLAVVGMFALLDATPGTGDAAQNGGPQNSQGGAGGADGGAENQGSQNEQANTGGGSNQSQQASAEPTTTNPSASASPEPETGGGTEEARRGGSDGEQQAQSSSPGAAAAQTIRDFYETAASPNYQESWNYLSPAYQQEFGTRATLTSQFQTLERVEFTEGPTTTELNGDAATVSASTIAYHSDRNEALTGTVDLVRTGNEWRISSLNFNPA